MRGRTSSAVLAAGLLLATSTAACGSGGDDDGGAGGSGDGALGENVVSGGQENEREELKSLSIVASRYGPPSRHLGAVSVIGPVRMDYGSAIAAVRAAANELSRFVGELYE